MKRLVLGVTAAAVAALWAGAAAAQPPVWVVKDKDSTIVLFGSVHVLPQGLDWRPPALTDSLAKADDVWFEIPIDIASSMESERAFEAKGILPKGDDLFRHLTPDQGERLRRIAQSLSLSEAALARMRPWFAEVTLSIAMDAKAGADATDGVEQQVQAQAPPKARRRAFETVAQQIDFLAGSPMADQISSLDETLTEIETKPETFQTVVDAWMKGDLAAVKAEAVDPLMSSTPGLYRRLIRDRNRRWVKQIRRRLGGSGVTVMVVGMGHLVGPEGVPALLRAEGVTVEGP